MDDFVSPPGLAFSELQLRHIDHTVNLAYDRDVLARVAIINGMPGRPAALQAVDLLRAWYRVHRAGGGACDPVMERLIAQAEWLGRRPRQPGSVAEKPTGF